MNTSPFNKKVSELDEIINQPYDFSITQVIKDAFHNVKGLKFIFFLGALLFIFISILLLKVEGFINHYLVIIDSNTYNSGIFINPEMGISGFIIYLFINFFYGFINALLILPFMYLALKKIYNKPIHFVQDFFYIYKPKILLPIVFSFISIYIFSLLGFIFFILPGIYLSIAFSLTPWIIITHPNISFLTAMKSSIKIINQHWFKFFFLPLILTIVFIVCSIPFGIGLLWAIPAIFLVYARIFQIIFDKNDEYSKNENEITQEITQQPIDF